MVEIVAPGEVEIYWETSQPANTILELRPVGGALDRQEVTRNGNQHRSKLTGIDPRVKYEFQIAGETSDRRKFVTPLYQFDPSLDYLPFENPEFPELFEQNERAKQIKLLAADMLKQAGTTRGFALVIGAGSGQLIYEMLKQSDMKIVVVEEDAARVQEIRRKFDEIGLYGGRVTVHEQTGLELPFGPYFANLITSEAAVENEALPTYSEEMFRVLRPAGGAVYMGHLEATGSVEETDQALKKWGSHFSTVEGKHELRQVVGNFMVYKRGKLPGSGEWTHQYGLPDNSSCSKDDRIAGAMSVLWWGRPGSRPMPDRGGRSPAPVSANGRMYVQGDRTLFGMDAYNGTILWVKQVPTMRRANIPRDGSNMVATDDKLYVAVEGYCLVFDGQTGERLQALPVKSAVENVPHHWGYLAVVNEGMLLATSTKRGSQYLGDDGEWFEDFEAEAVARVTSGNLYASDRQTGELKWSYQNGVIINSTITADDRNVYFVESRNPEALKSNSSRLLEPVQKDQHLVAVDLGTGEVKWEKPYDFSKCEYMTYMSFTNDTLLITGTDRNKKFHTYAFDSRNGYEIWNNSADSNKKHHSGQLSHPVLIDEKIYHNKQTVDLRTGNILKQDEFDWHGCGVMSASNNILFRRFEYHGMLDLETNERTEFLGVRSGCWLSLIPTGGILLAPESGSGCFCTHALQTSIAYYPVRSVLKQAAKPATKAEK